MELGKPQGGVDWQTVRAVLLRARPDWKPINSGAPTPEDAANRHDYELCEALLKAYPLTKCSHCKAERSCWAFYRCWDCKAFLCEDCIKSHFGNGHQPHPKLIEQYEKEIADLKARCARYAAADDARDEDQSLWT